MKRKIIIAFIVLVIVLLAYVPLHAKAQGTPDRFSFDTVSVLVVKADARTNKTVMFLPNADRSAWCGTDGCNEQNTEYATTIYNLHYMSGLEYNYPPYPVLEANRYVSFGYLYKDAVENFDAVFVEIEIYVIPDNKEQIMAVWSFYLVKDGVRVKALETFVVHPVSEFNAILSGETTTEKELY